MILNYIKIAWRNLVNQKLYSLINITGLAVGLAVCIVIMLYAAHEYSFDRFHKNSDRIITLHENLKIGDQVMSLSSSTYVTGPLVQQQVPGVVAYNRVYKSYLDLLVSKTTGNDKGIHEKKVIFADKDFFKFFSFKLISGLPDNVLNDPFDLVITADAAKRYFGSQDVIGKTLKIKNERDSVYLYHITGVAQNAPSNSSIQFDFIGSNTSIAAMPE